jgi:hypothetical protein
LLDLRAAASLVLQRQKQEVTEDLLWTEIYHIGDKSEGFEALKHRYPEAFAVSDEVNKKVEEIQSYTVAELGIDAMQLKLSDIIKIVEALVEFKLNERGNSPTTESAGDASEPANTDTGAAQV